MPSPPRGRKAIAATLRTLSELMAQDEEPAPARGGSRKKAPDGECFLCWLVDDLLEHEELDPDRVREPLAKACAYGIEVFAVGHGVFLCEGCDSDLRRARSSARRDVRSAAPDPDERRLRARRDG